MWPPPFPTPRFQIIVHCGNEFCNRRDQITARHLGEAKHIAIEHYWHPIPATDDAGNLIDIWLCPKCAPQWKNRIDTLKQMLKQQRPREGYDQEDGTERGGSQ